MTTFGKITLILRKNYVEAENKLFIGLQKIMNEFKNEQKTVYTAAKEYGFIE